MSEVKVTLKKSLIGLKQKQKETVKGLGLKKINSSKVLKDTPMVRGMIGKVSHLIEVSSV